MILTIWTRNDETGLLDDEFKDGDIDRAIPDGTPLGTQDVKSWLAIQIPDPPNLAKVQERLVKSEFAPGETPEDDHVVRRKRVFRLDWRSKFQASDIAIIEDATQVLPDGPLVGGGDVLNGIVSGKFTFTDLTRK